MRFGVVFAFFMNVDEGERESEATRANVCDCDGVGGDVRKRIKSEEIQ